MCLGICAQACGDHVVAPTDDPDVAAADSTDSAPEVDSGIPADEIDADDPSDAHSDAAADVPDTQPDAPADALADADSSPDVALDSADATDLVPDAASQPDVATATDGDATDLADSATQTAPDAGPPPCTSDVECLPAGGLAPCHSANCAAGTCSIVAVVDGTACDDGDPCTYSAVCLNGECSTGVKLNCDDGEPCTADSCALGACAHTPQNGPCEDGSLCTLGDSCKNGACVGGQLMDCEDGNVCTDNACDPGTGCKQLANAVGCTLLDLCQTGAQCSGGTCHAGPGTVCADGNPCTNDLCDPQTGFCQFLTTTNPCDDGNACTLGDLCQGGQCQPGAAKSCDDGSPCTGDACDGTTGTCVHSAVDSTCSDGSPCTVNDACANGVCMPGAPTNCDDMNPCTDDGCDAQTGCSHSSNSGSCSFGNACELAQCQAGKCITTGIKGCDDGNPCTSDTCVVPVGCVFTAIADGQTCSAPTPCEGAGTCAAGKCASGAKKDCSDGNPCTADHCDPQSFGGCYWLPEVGSCEDGDLCSGQDFCDNGKCRPGTLVGPATDCNDGNLCTDDTCVGASGCVHVANAMACDDGNVCTIFEQCTSGVCQGGALATCEDGNSCTLDVCAPTTGACSWFPKPGTCDDANPCTVGEQCIGAFCVGTVVSCDDGNPCSADACDVLTGICGHTALASAVTCSDGDACTVNDSCAGLTCSGVAIAASLCSDGNVCTVDVCNSIDGTCSWSPSTGACDDGNPCTVGDVCGSNLCVAGVGALCDDLNACTIDQCSLVTGACTHSPEPAGTTCDDGLACTDASACVNGLCAPAVAHCTLFTDTFGCGVVTTWNLPLATNTNVLWAIDQTPVIPNSAAHGCMLNYNNGVDYCGGGTGFYCAVSPTLVAISPNIDATDPHGMPRLAFDTWYQLDGPLPGGTGFGDGKTDVPLVVLRDVATSQILDQFLLSKSNSGCNGPCQSVWRSVSLDEPKVVGHVFRVELSLASPTNWGNQGKGWFVDNLKMTQEFSKESCNNGVDDDGNGRIDCADPVCVGKPGC